MSNDNTLLEVKGLKVHFPIRQGFFNRVTGHIRAVDDVSFSIEKGETLGLVGESGSGKTTVGRGILRAVPPTAGSVLYHNDDSSAVDVLSFDRTQLRAYRRKVQLIFQDPYSSLNPRMTIRDIVGEPLYVSGVAKGADLEDRVARLLKQVGMSPEHLGRYPHAFSGGQRQRIGIARSLALNPELIIADEPVSALDVSVQAQVINLMLELQNELGLSYLFVAHDLSVVRHISHRIAVMYLGHVVEVGSTKSLFAWPRHPYTASLLDAVPEIAQGNRERRRGQRTIQGEIADPSNPPPGCPFNPRCPRAKDICRTTRPDLREIARDSSTKQLVACHFPIETPRV